MSIEWLLLISHGLLGGCKHCVFQQEALVNTSSQQQPDTERSALLTNQHTRCRLCVRGFLQNTSATIRFAKIALQTHKHHQSISTFCHMTNSSGTSFTGIVYERKTQWAFLLNLVFYKYSCKSLRYGI